MKKRLLLLSLLPIAAVALAAPSIVKNNFIEVVAGSGDVTSVPSGYEDAKLPTTIDLNEVPSDDIRDYYKDLNGKNLNGEDLLKALKPILKNGQQYHSYDNTSNKSIWKAYEITDRDWKLSPAESTTYGTYDPSTNTIKNYQYGTGSSNVKNNPYQHLYYRNRGVSIGKVRAWDDTHGKNGGVDREHIWPKSRGFGKDDSGREYKVPGARGDLHHLVASEHYVNNAHNAWAYGFVDKNAIERDCGESFKIDGQVVVAGNYLGKPLNISNKTNIVFEPQDSDKGDIARACFYMVARYNNLAGDDPVIDAGNPNLAIDDETYSTNDGYLSTATKTGNIGILRDLLAWHKLDPVDEYEIHRNDLIYRNYDKNRNPFIDFPEWVDAIWGTVELAEDNRTITNRDTTPKGVASPATDAVYLNGGGSGGNSSSSEPAPSSSGEMSSSVAPVISSSTSSSGGSGSGSNLPLPLPVIIAIAAGAVIILVILIIVATKGKGKSKKAARKALKNVAKSATKSNKKKK